MTTPVEWPPVRPHLGNAIAKSLKAGKIRVLSALRAWRLRLMGVQVGRHVTFAGPINTRLNGDPRRIVIKDNVTFLGRLDLRNRENGGIIIESDCVFDDGLRLVAARESTIHFHEGCSSGIELIINAGGNISIGKRTMFSSYVVLNGSAHLTYREEFIEDQGYEQGWLDIGEDCWLANCTNVLMNTRIGKGAIISANTVVSGEIPEYAIMSGTPARKIGERAYRNPEAVEVAVTTADMDPATIRTQCREVFRELSTHGRVPADDAALRGGGELDSLGWYEFLVGVEARLGIEIPAALSSRRDFDSFSQIADRLAGEAKGLDLPDAPWTLYQRFADLAAAEPTAEILHVKEESGEFIVLSRSDLLTLANRFAAYLVSQGVKPGDRIGIIYPTSSDLIAAHLACLQIGAIPSMHAYPSAKVSAAVYAKNQGEVFARLRLNGLICSDTLATELKPLIGETTCLYTNDWRELSPMTDAYDARPDDIAVIQHSSGSTGSQKGVALSHAAISRQIAGYSEACDLNGRDRIVSWLPLYHDMGFVACYLTSISTGVPLCLVSPFDWIANPPLLWQAIERVGGTITWMPNFAFRVMKRATPSSRVGDLRLERMRAFVSCSEPVAADTMREFAGHFGAAGVSEDRLWSCYAMAENTFAVTQARGVATIAIDPAIYATEQRIALQPGGRELVSQGVPVAGSRVRIVDDAGDDLPADRVGEILVQSESMLTEYYDNPTATEAVMVDGWYRTGDLGFLHGGELYISGRKKDMIISGGRNFYPQDMEEIANGIAGIKAGRSCAFGVFDDRAGTEQAVILAERDPAVECEPGQVEQALRQAIADRLDCALADFQLLEPGTLIKTSSGKIARSACRDMYVARRDAETLNPISEER